MGFILSYFIAFMLKFSRQFSLSLSLSLSLSHGWHKNFESFYHQHFPSLCISLFVFILYRMSADNKKEDNERERGREAQKGNQRYKILCQISPKKKKKIRILLFDIKLYRSIHLPHFTHIHSVFVLLFLSLSQNSIKI